MYNMYNTYYMLAASHSVGFPSNYLIRDSIVASHTLELLTSEYKKSTIVPPRKKIRRSRWRRDQKRSGALTDRRRILMTSSGERRSTECLGRRRVMEKETSGGAAKEGGCRRRGLKDLPRIFSSNPALCCASESPDSEGRLHAGRQRLRFAPPIHLQEKETSWRLEGDAVMQLSVQVEERDSLMMGAW